MAAKGKVFQPQHDIWYVWKYLLEIMKDSSEYMMIF